MQIKGKKKNHLYKTKVDVGEFAHHGSTTKQEIAFGKASAKETVPVLTVRSYDSAWRGASFNPSCEAGRLQGQMVDDRYPQEILMIASSCLGPELVQGMLMRIMICSR